MRNFARLTVRPISVFKRNESHEKRRISEFPIDGLAIPFPGNSKKFRRFGL